MFKHILLPVDLSHKHGSALEMAAHMAAQNRGAVTLLHVIEVIHGMTKDEEKPFYERLERFAHRHLETLGQHLAEGKIPWQAVLIYGSRVQETIRYAQEKKVDLMIMTSPRMDPDHLRESFASLSYPMAFVAPCPVLLVR
jgi:nucleotide-binding universal stress UspA family protein